MCPFHKIADALCVKICFKSNDRLHFTPHSRFTTGISSAIVTLIICDESRCKSDFHHRYFPQFRQNCLGLEDDKGIIWCMICLAIVLEDTTAIVLAWSVNKKSHGSQNWNEAQESQVNRRLQNKQGQIFAFSFNEWFLSA